MTKHFILLAAMAAITAACCAQTPSHKAESLDFKYITTAEDSTLAVSIIDSLRATYDASGRSATTPELMIKAGLRLLGNDYVASTLEEGDREDLRLYLYRTDCILFVETCTNLALAAKFPSYENSFYSFADNVRQTRYRNGHFENYSDRIHYTTEWIRQAESRGILEDKTREFGGKLHDHPFHFMSSHSGSYKHLKNADTDSLAALNLETIAKVEERLSEEPQYIIADTDIKKAEPFIQSGDIIGYMTDTDGLDIGHVVLACVTDKDGNIVFGPHGDDVKVGFMHASMKAMKVIIDPQSISDYACSSKSIPGIKVVRVL